MAYVDQEQKKRINEQLKTIKKNFEKSGGKLRYSLKVQNHSTLVLTIRECSLDLLLNYSETVNEYNGRYGDGHQVFWSDYHQVNHYYLERQFTGKALELMTQLNKALHAEHWDESDIMTDYFNCAYYVSINIGDWDKPFIHSEVN